MARFNMAPEYLEIFYGVATTSQPGRSRSHKGVESSTGADEGVKLVIAIGVHRMNHLWQGP